MGGIGTTPEYNFGQSLRELVNFAAKGKQPFSIAHAESDNGALDAFTASSLPENAIFRQVESWKQSGNVPEYIDPVKLERLVRRGPAPGPDATLERLRPNQVRMFSKKLDQDAAQVSATFSRRKYRWEEVARA